MKRASFLLLTILALACYNGYAQRPENTSCSNPLDLCEAGDFSFDINHPCNGTTVYFFKFHLLFPTTIQVGYTTGAAGYQLSGPYTGEPTIDTCAVFSANIFALSATPVPVYYTIGTSGTPVPAGYYLLALKPDNCAGSLVLNLPGEALDCPGDTLPCENCIGSFAPEVGKKYLVSAWVREDNAALDKISFTNPSVTLDFIGSGQSTGAIYPTGLIIDGWQRVEQEFTIPGGTNQLDIKLACTTGDCFFDDIRILPFDGSMKSYVYDPVTLRLAAELDERNYATFYEYDEEGKLVRIKKETEKGIMTIQETKTSIPKKP